MNKEIAATRESLGKQKDWLARKLRIMQRYGYAGDMVMILMSAEDISQTMRVWKYLENLTRYEHDVLASYRANLKALGEKSERLRLLKAELAKNAEKVKSNRKRDGGQKKRERSRPVFGPERKGLTPENARRAEKCRPRSCWILSVNRPNRHL